MKLELRLGDGDKLPLGLLARLGNWSVGTVSSLLALGLSGSIDGRKTCDRAGRASSAVRCFLSCLTHELLLLSSSLDIAIVCIVEFWSFDFNMNDEFYGCILRSDDGGIRPIDAQWYRIPGRRCSKGKVQKKSRSTNHYLLIHI